MKKRNRVFIVLAGLLLLAVMLALAGYDINSLAEDANAPALWFNEHPWRIALFIIIVSVWSVLLPTTLPILFAGFAFGMYWGTVYTYAATTLAFVVSYCIGRYLLGSERAEKIRQHRVIKAAAGELHAHPFWYVAALRLAPWVPFQVQNLAYGVLHISFWHCLAATLIGKFVNVFITILAGAALAMGLSESPYQDQTQIIIWICVVIGFIGTLFITARIRRRLQEELGIQDEDGTTDEFLPLQKRAKN